MKEKKAMRRMAGAGILVAVACLGPAAGTAATTNGSCVTNLAGYVADVKF